MADVVRQVLTADEVAVMSGLGRSTILTRVKVHGHVPGRGARARYGPASPLQSRPRGTGARNGGLRGRHSWVTASPRTGCRGRHRRLHHLAGRRRQTGRITSDRDRKVLQALMTGADLSAMKLLPMRPAWWAEAACRARPDVDFFPEQGQSAAPAKAVCAGCPAREACLDFAVEEHIDFGVWGGQGVLARKKARAGTKRRPKPSPVGAGRWRERSPPDVRHPRAKRAG